MTLPATTAPDGTRRSQLGLLERLSRTGVAACGEVELLSVATGYPLAEAAAVLERLGGIEGIAGASVSELVAAGIAPRRGAALAAAIGLARRAHNGPPPGRWVIRAPADLAERVADEMAALDREELRVAVLNMKHVVTALVTVYVGSLTGCPVRVGEVFHDAVRRHGAAIVVVHNHPSGDPAPSPEDLRITAELARAGALLDIELLDHLVIGRGRWVSLRGLGAIA